VPLEPGALLSRGLLDRLSEVQGAFEGCVSEAAGFAGDRGLHEMRIMLMAAK
jgi:hypothetical protein